MTNTFAMTGGATGIGAAVKEKLRAEGHRVIVIDLKDADVVADLSKPQARGKALEQVADLAPEGLDGFIACAGLGPHVQPASLIDRVNFFGAVATIEAAMDLLKKKNGVVVAVGSNSSVLPGLDQNHVQALLDGDEERACELVDTLDGQNAYGGSKNALTRWVRQQAPALMKQGVRMNAVAPGMTTTPLTDRVFEDETYGQAMRDFSQMIPCGEIASPDMIADAILFLLSPASRYVCGSVLFVDGGQDALIRPDCY
ncbi:SDR family oxidoreductase [Pseudomaricurvus alkylphenolicus]|jgi:NAD(P)-dependent dehydrogenase (short-subunit alcohol dehydrogenase family)|uniref:SDR family oxidoreductase n=1 Tax=Pseudomaricurvus alkylphenolicus TaxID=1306991 RepID=UPI001420B7E9|nr:SDR family oxidoreductase [Pseudomaricurvus alkylphenolicus]NIB40897.1 SDR family oxidoreductase [Pseudomaricurvus alkylphenolicus]